jgi:leucyl-tRNA synthetase
MNARTRFDLSYEQRWQEAWAKADLFRAERHSSRPKWFIVELPPFTNGRLHLGHVRNYVIGDVIARFRRALGHDVLYTTGFDSFGLPNEIAAREEKTAPAVLVTRNQPLMSAQLRRLGLSHDPARIMSDHDPDYYRWVQWVFLKLRESGLAFRRRDFVHWCVSCGTTLADSLVEQGRCWRCRNPVSRIEKEQWFIRETALAEDVLAQDLPGWPKPILDIHADWIGRRHGFDVDLRIAGHDLNLPLFVESVDDLTKAAFIMIAPGGAEARMLGLAETLGVAAPVATGFQAVEPMQGRSLPILCGETGRRGEEGTRLGLPSENPDDAHLVLSLALSPALGASVPSHPACVAPAAIRPAIRTRLRDWDIARSRYWGTPVPVIHCEACGEVGVPETQLPVLLPLDVDLSRGGNPLETLAQFTATACPGCDRPARRETDTLEAYSSPWWYYLISKDPTDQNPFGGQGTQDWMPVDLMIGGADQARTCFFHLRSLAEALTRIGIVQERHPVRGLLAIGMVKAEGRKMSKSAGNSIDPESLLDTYGADAVRFATVAAAAPEQEFNWSNDGVVRAARFLAGLRRFFERNAFDFSALPDRLQPSDPRRQRIVKWLMAASEKTTGSLQRHALHVATKQVEFLATQLLQLDRDIADGKAKPDAEAMGFAGRWLLQLLSPFVPHLAEELWFHAKGAGFLTAAAWPDITGPDAGRQGNPPDPELSEVTS